MSYSLPEYYFQDLPPDVMDEIMRGMEAALPGPSWEEIDQWLNTHNVVSTIPSWFDLLRAENRGIRGMFHNDPQHGYLHYRR